LVHRGVVAASGIAIDVTLVGEGAARARALRSWARGASVLLADEWLIVRLAAPRLLDADAAPGAPLVAMGARLVAAPLSVDELGALDAPGDAIVLVRGGAAVSVDPRGVALEDLAAWIEIGHLEVISVESLGRPPAPMSDPAPAATDARALLGLDAASPERQRLLDALGASAGSGSRGGARWWLASFVAGVGGLLSRLFRRQLVAASSELAAAGGARASLPQRVGAWLQNVIARALVHARLAQRIGARHAEHLRRVLEMMDRGDYEEALRHAIPVGGPVDEDAAHVALRAAAARTSLAIRPKATRARAIVPFTDDVQQHLRQTYRRAFERLAAQSRNEEAAFVLAELLHANDEAVSFLENVGQKRLAAQLAEARGLAPGLVVRQWFVAGDLARAISVARRTAAFADAIVRLERQSKDDARALRVAWAESLAVAGDYSAAQEIAWPVEAARPLARVWIDLAIEAGGIGGAKALVRKLSLDPEALAGMRERLEEILRDPGPAAALAEALLATTPVTPVLRHLARRSARAFLRLPMPGQARKRLVSKLIERSGDAALRADMPALLDGAPVPLLDRVEPIVLHVPRGPSSGARALGAVRLPNGRTLVALGEAGVSLLSSDGRVVFHADQPAYEIVVSDAGDRALALAPRGEIVRIARLDLLRRRGQHWQDVPIERWAPDFDGTEWFVVQGQTVAAVDVYDDARFGANWRVDVSGIVTNIARSRSALLVHAGPPSESHVWRYDVPSMTLRSRAPLSLTGNVLASALSTCGSIATIVAPPDGEQGPRRLMVTQASARETGKVAPIVPAGCLSASDGWIVSVDDDGAACLLDIAQQKERVRVVVDGRVASARLHAETLTVVDERGAIAHVSLATGESSILRT
jgi:hypothetical protein